MNLLRLPLTDRYYTVRLIVFKDIKFVDSQNFALNKNFHGKIQGYIDNPQSYLPYVAYSEKMCD